MKRKLMALTIIMLTALLAVACTGGAAATPTATPPPEPGVQPTSASGEAKIVIANFAFDPVTVTVPVGTTVTWTNEDSATHTITSDSGDWDSGRLKNGQLFSHTFTEAGTFSYHCSIHSSMKGTIIVTP
jgi:plastocyanin